MGPVNLKDVLQLHVVPHVLGRFPDVMHDSLLLHVPSINAPFQEVARIYKADSVEPKAHTHVYIHSRRTLMDVKMSIQTRAIRNTLTFLKLKMLPWRTCPLIKTNYSRSFWTQRALLQQGSLQVARHWVRRLVRDSRVGNSARHKQRTSSTVELSTRNQRYGCDVRHHYIG